ncbi:eukaryotic translation initiation factor 3 subunit G-like [Styela clava]
MPSEDSSKVSWADAAEPSSWADQVEEAEVQELGHDQLPPSSEKKDGNTKIITEYKINEDGKKVKIVRTYKIEIQKTSKSVARRKHLPKFGVSKEDPPGPNRATTIISEDVNLQFINSRQEEIHDQEDPMLSKFRNQLQYYMFFKNFKTGNRPSEKEEEEKKDEVDSPTQAGPGGGTGGKYVPPSLRAGATARGSSMPSRGARDEQATIRVTNLSEETKESDLQELFRPFGPIQRIYLAKDKHTQQSKGFAFINFYKREDAAKAIQAISGFGYDHLILNVEWAKPSTPAAGGGP